MVPLRGFMPDADQTVLGVLSDCENLIPTLKGYAGRNSLVTPLNVPALAAACTGAATVTKLTGARRIFAGTATAIYELVGGAWDDVSKSGGYTAGDWSIAQFGDSTLAATSGHVIQRSTTGDFADISGAPQAEIIFSVNNFVMALNTNTSADQWHCCAAYDDTDWTESTTTLSASGRLVSAPGTLTAGGRLGEYAVAYKGRAIYLGQFVGAPDVWQWQLVRGGNAGCVGKRAWTDVDGVHFLVGEDNFWLFDGSTPVPLADGILKKWFSNNSSKSYKYLTTCVYDKATSLVWVFYPSTNASSLDSALVYHVQTKQWGRASINIESSMVYVTPSITIDGLDSYAATIDELPAIPFDSPFWNAASRSLAVFNASHQLQIFSGQSVSSSFTTGDVGDDYLYSLLQRIKLRFATKPTTAEATLYEKENSGDDWTETETVTMENSTFDVLQSSRWHKAKISFTGPVEITAMNAETVQDGSE